VVNLLARRAQITTRFTAMIRHRTGRAIAAEARSISTPTQAGPRLFQHELPKNM
jgi:hypothetical protein